MADEVLMVTIELTGKASSGSANDIKNFNIESRDDLDTSGNEYTVHDTNGEIAHFPKENVASVSVR